MACNCKLRPRVHIALDRTKKQLELFRQQVHSKGGVKTVIDLMQASLFVQLQPMYQKIVYE